MSNEIKENSTDHWCIQGFIPYTKHKSNAKHRELIKGDFLKGLWHAAA